MLKLYNPLSYRRRWCDHLPMLRRFLLLLIATLLQARIVRHHRDRPAPGAGATPMPCSAPVQKARVVFPESIGGRLLGHQGWSGYVNVIETDHLFYWYFEAQANASTAPLVFWSNGGPGCSAMEGAKTEHGPLSLTYIKLSHDLATGQLSDNPWAWSKDANVVYVDQPRYVGFSYGSGPMVKSSVAERVYAAAARCAARMARSIRASMVQG